MKVAILTFQGANSYGALLQAYALQTAIRAMGHDVELLGYRCPAIQEDYGFPRTPRGIAGRLLRTPFFQIRQKKFDSFRKRHLSIRDGIERSGITSAAEAYDVIVVGSDQVWNPEITGNDSTYYLDFCAGGQRRVAYAASIGIKAWDASAEPGNLMMLAGFDYLSVREATAQEYLATCGIQAEVVCDPTLLIAPDGYHSLSTNPVPHGRYTLLLCLQNPYAKSIEFARDIAYRRGERLVVLHSGWHFVHGVQNIRSAGPCDFLTVIKNASCVITESFHGCCFSVVFNRNFYYFDPRNITKGEDRTSRITDLLKELGLESRDSRANVYQHDDIDYQEVNKRLDQIRRRSTAFLERSLDGIGGTREQMRQSGN